MPYLSYTVAISFLFSLCVTFKASFSFAQSTTTSTLNPTNISTGSTALNSDNAKPVYTYEEVEEGGGTNVKLLKGEPNKRRIRRQLNLIAGVKHDEEILLPEIPLTYKGNVEFLDIQRIKSTDMFRILPTKVGNGIITVHNKTTGQILVELRFDIRDQTIEKTLREIQALLADIEGIEYKIVNGKIVLDGYVLLPKDLHRIGAVMSQYGGDGPQVSSLVTLSPIAKKKIVEYISRDINNPEITVSSIGDFIKLEGFVNSKEEKDRISDIVVLYLPEIVTEKGKDNLKNIAMVDRKPQTDVSAYVINLIRVREQQDKPAEPPPKMIQVVIHIVEYSERYLKNFDFMFSPSLTALGGVQSQAQQAAPNSVSDIAGIVENLLPKLNWARNHGYIKLLDTASILTQNAFQGSINRTINFTNGKTAVTAAGAGGGAAGGQGGGSQNTYGLNFSVTPTIKAERSGLVELVTNITSSTGGGDYLISPNTTISTRVSVRDRQSAALAGVITKKSSNDYGGPTGAGAIVTLNHGKKFQKASSNYVVFITPIIKSSASAGVEQVKKKFRMKE